MWVVDGSAINLSGTLERTKGVALGALEAKVRYPSIVPRYKEKVEHTLARDLSNGNREP